MNELVRFDFKGAAVRTVEQGGQTWFVAADVLKAVGINRRSTDYLDKLDESEKGYRKFDTLGGPQRMAIVNESGLYGLTFMSRKPEAVKFRLWVTSEVLPAIRREGGYVSPGASAEQLRRLTSRIRRLELRESIFGNRTPLGTLSAATGHPRIIPVHAYLRSANKRFVMVDSLVFHPELFEAEG